MDDSSLQAAVSEQLLRDAERLRSWRKQIRGAARAGGQRDGEGEARGGPLDAGLLLVETAGGVASPAPSGSLQVGGGSLRGCLGGCLGGLKGRLMIG